MRLERISPKQKKIFEFAGSDKTYLICDGAVRSGKTVCMIAAFIVWAMAYQNGANYAICAKTVQNAERNVIAPLLSLDGFKRKCKYHRADHCLECTINGRTNKFYVFGGKDESSYTLIQGVTLAGAMLDEVALMPRSFVEQCMARTLTYADKKIWFNCNPENQLHWFNTEWIEKADSGERRNVQHLHFLMDDNPILSQKQINDAAEMFSGVFYRRYILGEWVMADGLIYDMFDADLHITDDIETEGDHFVSCDYGIQNATTFLLWRKVKQSNAWVCLKEWYYSGRENHVQKTVAQLKEGLKQMLGDIVPRQVIIDPSASALIAELRKDGFHCLKANNDVVDGISDVSTMLHQRRLLFHRSCRHTIQEFGVYAWDKKAADRGEDRPIKDNDHCMDAVRYIVKTKHLVKPQEEYKGIF